MTRHASFGRIVTVYVIGFISSLVLSLVAFLAVTQGWLGEAASATMAFLLLLAAIQLTVQLVCFLHLGADRNPFSRTGTFLFAAGTLLVIIIGSVWIMNNLDYRMHTSSESMEEYMLEQNKKGF